MHTILGSTGIRRAARLGAIAVVAAWSVGFAVGDAPAAPLHNAATIAERSGQAGEDFHWSWRIPAGKAIEIEGVNGAIHAVATSGERVEVSARKHARRSDPGKVAIEVLEHEGGVTLCVRYPDSRWGPHNVCAPNGKSHMSTHDNDVQVDFEVRVPAGVRFVARTVNGGVDVETLDGPVEARTVNGSIAVSTRRLAVASTVNGSIRAAFGSTSWDEPLEFTTVNGSITLDLSAHTDADVQAGTVNGGIETDFPITVQGRFNHRHLEGRIGKGGPRLELSTVNGSIRLRMAKES
ncbi:MAG: hypothetical protein HZC42_08910 [Candidatus Eisenbacteria bacterium]|nr:hypothetical protein [Candidatus Eisenbacteria bacterium]